MLLTRNYDKKSILILNRKEHQLRFFYPLCLFLINYIPILKKASQNPRKKDVLKVLTFTKDLESVTRYYFANKMAVAFLIILAFNSIAVLSSVNGEKEEPLIVDNAILRPEYGEDSKEVELNVAIEDGEDYIEGELLLEIDPKHYDSETKEKMFTKAKSYLEKHLIGENVSLEEICKPLNLVTVIPGTGMEVDWKLDEKKLIERNGVLNNKDINPAGVLTSITAILTYYDMVTEYIIPLKIMPLVISKEERVLSEVEDLINKSEKDTQVESQMPLPETVDDRKIWFQEEEKRSPAIYIIAGMFFAVIATILVDQNLDKKLKKREIELLIDYPEIMNKFSLLLGAGMTMKNAWGKIVSEYHGKIKSGQTIKRYAYEEMTITWNEMVNGVIETKAFENFGRRIKLLPYLKFSSLLTQNIKKGMKGLLDLLELEALEALEERKELAKRLGEEAGTKLIGPMILMLFIVLLIIMIPAFLLM